MNSEITKYEGRNDHELNDSQIQEAFDDVCAEYPEETVDSCVSRVCESMAISVPRFDLAFKNAEEQKFCWDEFDIRLGLKS
tara:strand:- start:2858 stop:3100 length:243 start_codon:yes stop_codon:yes gene_type:complete